MTDEPPAPKPRGGKLLPAALVGVLVLTAGLVGLAFLTNDGGGGDGGPAGAATPITLTGVKFTTWNVGEAARFPDDLAVVVKQGCFDCPPPDHYVKSVARVSRDALGVIRSETLFSARPSQPIAESGAPIPTGAYILEVAARPGALEIVVTVCATGGCTQHDQPVPGASTVLYRSVDGGATWSEWGRPGGVARAIFVVADGVVLATQDGSGTAYSLYPQSQPVVAPANTKDARLQVTPAGDVGWVATDASGTLRLLTATLGTPLPALPAKATLAGPVYFLDESHVVTTSEIQSQRGVDDWPRFDAISTLDGVLERGFTGARVVPVASVSAGVAIGDITLPPDKRTIYPIHDLPGIIDYNSGTVSPFAVPFAGPGEKTPARVLAAQQGPFIRINRRSVCAEVHANSSPQSPVLACYAANVLLKHVPAGDIQGWYSVSTLDGRPGFVSIENAEK